MLIKLFSYIPAIIGILVIGAFVLLNNPKKNTNKIFFILNLNIAVWLFTLFIADVTQSTSVALIAIRTANALGTTISLLFLYFSLLFPFTTKLKKYQWFIISIPTILFVLLCYSNLITPAVEIQGFGAQPLGLGVPYIALTIYQVINFVAGFIVLFYKHKKSDGNSKEQIKYVLIASILALVINIFANFILPIFQISTNTVLLGGASLFLFSLIVGYAIVRHQLFDIRFVVARSVTYVLTIGVIAVLYGFIAFRFAAVFLDNLSPQIQQTFYVILTVIFAFTFAPLRRFFERISNKIFYRDHYDAQVLVNEVGRILASEIDLDKVSNKVLQEITSQIKIGRGEIVVFGENQLFYENNVFKNGGGQISPADLSKLGRIMLVADDLQSGDRKELMKRYGISISLALRTSEKFIGYMLLGEKKSGDIYNDQDLRVLKIIANEVSVAMANALSYKEIQLFSETLAAKVRQRTGQLRHANDQLKELDKAKDEFISMASHQLRTPLTTVKGYASMLEEGDFGKLTKEQMKIVEQTLDGSNRMARLIDDLLNVSRMDANRFFLEADKVDIVKLVNEELTQLKTLAESKKIKLTYTPPKGKIPIILLDENKTRQVVMNITDNAIHYSAPPAGGGNVHVSMVLKGNFVEFKVTDDGIGVPAEAQDKLFTKMFRAANAQGVRPDGTGLGLYLVKRVVEEQGGEIIFSSEPGKGSTFGFRLPLSGIPKETLEESKKIGAKVAASHK